MSKCKDISGKIFGRLLAVRNTNVRSKNGDYLWDCVCDCGGTITTSIGRLNYGVTKSCGCLKIDNHHRTHGFSHKNKAYKSWSKIKERCFDTNCPDYKDYGGVGITLSENFRKDFMAFYKEVGDPPNTEKRWSIDRIDNAKGYVEGNLRWADDFQQARNRGKNVNNTSGMTGVRWDDKTPHNSNSVSLYATAQWNTVENGKSKFRKKCFSVKKYGLLPAFAMACAHREQVILELNALGYGYANNHGK